jgi:cytochrome c oxidase subunit 2
MEKFLGLPPLASEHGADVDRLILYMHLLMGALFIGWFAYFVYVLFRFRASKNPKASYTGTTSTASSYIEGAVVLAEAVLLVGFALPLWGKIAGKFPAEKDSTVIQVTAQQFQWNARYAGPDGVFGQQDPKYWSAENPLAIVPGDTAAKDDVSPPLNEIAAPVNKPVIAYITSRDVIHSFKVNPLRVTQDAIPGMKIPLWFKPTVEGDYMINCAQLCGNSHYFMKGIFKVMSQEKFNAWMAEKSKAGGPASFE